jgi:hypothetical protein
VSEVRAQLAAATDAVQVTPVPSLTVTVPVGMPAPGGAAETENVTVYASPTTVGLGSVDVTVAVVVAWFTVWAGVSVVELAVKSAVPGYAAVTECVPTANPVAGGLTATPLTKAVGAPRFDPSTWNCTDPVGVPPALVTVAVYVTACPNTAGFTDATTAVAVAAGFTWCATPTDVLGAKLPSPAYAAVSVFAPAVTEVRVQFPVFTAVLHETPLPSLTVTEPVGVPPVLVTVKLTVYGWPTVEGSGVSPVMLVVVGAAVTDWATPTDALPRKFPSPAYVAVSVFAPAVVNVIGQLPPATVPVQLVPAPSSTVTLPVGVPLPGVLTATA